MINFERFILNFFATFELFVSRKYVFGDKAFTRVRKMSQKDYTKYILTQFGCNGYTESIRFFTKSLNRKFETITSQAIGKQRMFLKPELYKDLTDSFIDKLYGEFKGFSKFKGYVVCACDGSIFSLPITKTTRKEFDVPDDSIFEVHRVRSRVSCIMDVNSKFILTSKIVERSVDEITLALDHLKELNKRFNIRKFITIYDRGYVSLELMLNTEEIGSKYLIRLKKNSFINQRKYIRGDDEIIKINWIKSRLNGIRDEKLRKKAKENKFLEIRIVKVKLKTGEIELLATNLTKEEFTTEELKELYNQRWEIETGFKKLKSLVRIEEFTGNRRIIIEQDFYAHIFIYNLANAIKNDGQNKITRKPRNKEDQMIYQPNFSKIVGNIYLYFPDLLGENSSKTKITLEFLINQASKELVQKNMNKTKCDIRKESDITNKHPGNTRRSH